MSKRNPKTWIDMPRFGPLPDDESACGVAISKRVRSIQRARKQYALKLKRNGEYDGQGSR